MANTRNYYTKTNYNIHKDSVEKQAEWIFNTQSTVNKETHFPAMGVNMPALGSSLLSNNFVDIESRLLGIGSNNHENPQKPLKPELKQIGNKQFFEYVPLLTPVLPKLYQSQRPLRQ